MKKIIKEIPHEKEKCLLQMRWYLLRVIDEKDEIRRLALISLISEHVKHLED